MTEWLMFAKGLYSASFYWWLVSFLMVVSFIVLESQYKAESGHSKKGKIRNICYAFFYLVFGGLLVSVLLLFISVPTNHQESKTWLASSLSVFFALFLTDFLYYWYHRMQHAIPFWWAIHELHHADSEMNATTSWRTHFLEQPVQLMVVSLPVLYFMPALMEKMTGLTVFQLNSTELIVYTVFALIFLTGSHANVRLRLGWVTPLVTGPQFHRLHHSIEMKHRDKNFAQYFPVFDKLFGTYCAPEKDEFPKTGLSEVPSDMHPFITLIRPFVLWWR